MANFVLRGFIATFGICAIAWAIDVSLVYRAEASLPGTGQAILSGDRFSSVQLNAMRRHLDAMPVRPLQASSLNSAAIIRVLLMEAQLRAENRQPSASEIADLQASVSAALAQYPMNSFMWLTEFWLRRLHGETAERDLDLLRMSYWSGANEAWIAVRRNPVALANFPSLPGDLAGQALSEFAGLVRAGLNEDATSILAGPGWAIREQLLQSLTRVGEADRWGFARAVRSKDLDGVSIPGVAERPSRPF